MKQSGHSVMQQRTYETVLQASKEEVWKFFSNPKNLATITPPDLGFNIVRSPEGEIYPGAIIEYTVTPLLGIKMRWVTEITHVDPGVYFIDEQRFGPYAFWHHQHHFLEQSANKVRMVDILHYELPLRLLSEPVRRVVVAPKIEQIFSYRNAIIQEKFGPRVAAG